MPDAVPPGSLKALKGKSVAPMATPNCSTYGRSNCSRQDDWIMTIRA